jgi:hypothetical protein
MHDLTEEIKNLPHSKNRNVSSADIVMMQNEIRKVDERIGSVEDGVGDFVEYFENKSAIIESKAESFYTDVLYKIADLSSETVNSISEIHHRFSFSEAANEAANKVLSYFFPSNDKFSEYARAYDYVDGVVKEIQVNKKKLTIEDSEECYFDSLYYDDGLMSCTKQVVNGFEFVASRYVFQLEKNFPLIEAANDLDRPDLIGELKEYDHPGQMIIY